MTENQVENLQENKPNDKELNFRALEAKYKRELEQERSARIEATFNSTSSRKKSRRGGS